MGGLKQKGIVEYSMCRLSPSSLYIYLYDFVWPPNTAAVSPFATRPMAGAFSGYLFHGFKRIMGILPVWIVPIGIGYSVYTWGNAT